MSMDTVPTQLTFDRAQTRATNPANVRALEQYQTPLWAAEALTEIFLDEISRRGKKPGRILEPSCGTGNFLRVLPEEYDAYGIEIDPQLAWQARWNSGREIIEGDFRSCPAPLEAGRRPDHLLGNPPFAITLIRAFLARALELLPPGGTCGFLLPAHTFQRAQTLVEVEKNWGVTPWLIPRNIFPRISVPLIFALFEEGGESRGLALHNACARVHQMPKWLRKEMEETYPSQERKEGRPKGAWHRTVLRALESLGGRAELPALYRQIEPIRPTDNRHWKEKVRQILQHHFEPLGGGCWSCPSPSLS
jgi:predicted RNA methylase